MLIFVDDYRTIENINKLKVKITYNSNLNLYLFDQIEYNVFFVKKPALSFICKKYSIEYNHPFLYNNEVPISYIGALKASKNEMLKFKLRHDNIIYQDK